VWGEGEKRDRREIEERERVEEEQAMEVREGHGRGGGHFENDMSSGKFSRP